MATSASNLRNTGDRLVRTLGKLIAQAWFRGIETEGTDRISVDRPVLICANHANGFVDPVLIVATSPRPVRFLAKSTLWKFAPLGTVLNLAGVLPVYRQQDGGTDGNVNTFAACDAELSADGAIGLFPEGTVNDTLKLLPLHTGAARIALGAKAAGAEALRIVPVGLLYEDKAAPRTRVLVRVGEPIDLDDVWQEIVAPGESDGSDNRARRRPAHGHDHTRPQRRVRELRRRDVAAARGDGRTHRPSRAGRRPVTSRADGARRAGGAPALAAAARATPTGARSHGRVPVAARPLRADRP